MIIENGADNVIGCAISTWFRRWEAITGLCHKKAVSAECKEESHEFISRASIGQYELGIHSKGVPDEGGLYVGDFPPQTQRIEHTMKRQRG